MSQGAEGLGSHPKLLTQVHGPLEVISDEPIETLGMVLPVVQPPGEPLVQLCPHCLRQT